MPLQTKMRLGFGVALTALFAWAGWQAWEFATLARYMPLFIGVVGVLLGLVTVVTDYVNYRRQGMAAGGDVPATAAMAGAEEIELTGRAEKDESVEHPTRIAVRAIGYFGLILVYIAAIYVFGIFVAGGIFLVTFLRFVAKTGWVLPIVGTVIVLGGMSVLENLINVQWPPYLLEDVLGEYIPG